MVLRQTLSVFLPTRSGSERVKDKNTRDFAGVDGGLLRIKLEQLLKIPEIKEVVLSTNDPASIEVADKFFGDNLLLKIKERPERLAKSTTNLSDLVNYVPSIVEGEHILWTHVTSPFITTNEYEKIINAYFKNFAKYDSLMSVNKIQNFIWTEEKNEVINKRGGEQLKWPRTQDLIPLYEVNSGAFIYSKKGYIENCDRIGFKPYLWNQSHIDGFDIDWEEDFNFAQKIWKSLINDF